jgi:hypothetical protein
VANIIELICNYFLKITYDDLKTQAWGLKCPPGSAIRTGKAHRQASETKPGEDL